MILYSFFDNISLFWFAASDWIAGTILTAIIFEVPDRKFDLAAAAKAAAEDYCKTPDGREEYKSNCDYYNWGDFVSIPNEFCEKYGFSIVKDARIDEVVALNEQLVESMKTND